MRTGVRLLIPAAAFLLASAAFAQPIRVGSLSNGESFVVTAPTTLIDLTHPATASGSLTTATIVWSSGEPPCAAAVKIKFFRPTGSGSAVFLGERGPFNVSGGLVTVALSPPFPVEAGDFIGVAQLKSASACGGVWLSPEGSGYHTVAFAGDVTSGVDLCDQASIFEDSVSVEASGQAETYAGTIPGAGSAHGASGGDFKTSVQLFNPGPSEIRGRLVFHPMGVSGSPNDPSISYDLASDRGVNFDDLVAAAGTSGLGSLDVLTQSSPPPLVVARIFNDAGAAGTAGFSEPFIHPGDPTILRSFPFDLAYFIGPADVSRYRVNFGVRSFQKGVKLQVTVISPDGSESSFVHHEYSPDEFVQLSPKDFTGLDLPAGATVEVQILDGNGVVYMVTVDNVTNDTSIQIGDRRQS